MLLWLVISRRMSSNTHILWTTETAKNGSISAMARSEKQDKKNKKLEKSKKDSALAVAKPSFIELVGSETLRGMAGVVLFVLGLLLTLAALGMAGRAGEKSYHGLLYLFGVGYFLLPLLLVFWAVSLFRSAAGTERNVGPVRAFGALLFFLSSLSIVSVIAHEHGGVLGGLIATPLVMYFDTVASIVLLAGVLMVSLLLLFDSALWVQLFTNAKKLVFRPKKAAADELDAFGLPLPPASTEEPQEEYYPDEEPVPSAMLEPEPEPIKPNEEEAFEQLIDKSPTKKQVAVVLPSEYTPPPLSILERDKGKPNVGDTKARANIIRRTLHNFGIRVEMDEITVGPTVTRYSLKPAEGVKLSKILGLQSNLEYALAASPIRIEAPIPGKSLVGIEVPNTGKSIVGLAGLLAAPEFTDAPAPLLFALGKDIAGGLHYADIAEMPHLLIAGATKSGKSVMVHTLVTSLLYRNGPERLRLILVDPKRVELTLYDSIPHLLTPVITDPKKTILSLKWAAKEMDRRYDVLRSHKVRDIASYHGEILAPQLEEYEKKRAKGASTDDVEVPELMPHIVIVIDELADIMQAYPRELEAAIVRLAQMSRAVGIHLILSTQRPSVNVVTGLIKANIPARLALKVSSLIDSRTILDGPGAEKLLGAGDMLFQGSDMPKPRRIQSPYITAAEVKKITSFLAKHNDYAPEAQLDLSGTERGAENMGGAIPFGDMEDADDVDGLYEEIRAFVVESSKASTSLIQRRFKIGYGRAARIMDQLEERGVIAASDGTNKPRAVLDRGGVSGNDSSEPLGMSETGSDDEEDGDNVKFYGR